MLLEPVPAMTLIRPAACCDDGGDHPLVLVVGQRGRFAGGADRDQSRRAGLDLEVDVAAQQGVDRPRRRGRA